MRNFHQVIKKYLDNNYKIILLLLVISVIEMLWLFVFPIWSLPDEPAHFAQIEHYAVFKKAINQNLISKEELNSLKFNQFNNFTEFLGHQNFTPNSLYYSNEKIFYKKNNSSSSIKDFNYKNPVEHYPPLYYILGSIIYDLFYNQNILFHAETIRIFTILISLVGLYFAYKIGILIFPKDKLFRYVLPITIGLFPMFDQTSVSINPGNLVNMLSIVFTYFYIKFLINPKDIKNNIYIAVTLLLGLFTKENMFILLLTYLVSIFFLIYKNHIKDIKYILYIISMVTVAILIMILSNLMNIISSYTEALISHTTNFSFISYILSFGPNYYFPTGRVFQSFWGNFGWLTIPFSIQLFDILYIITVLSIIGLGVYLYKNIHNKNIFKIFIFLFLEAIIYTLFLMLLDYSSLKNGAGNFTQGHYFLFIIAPIMILFITGITALFKEKYKNLAYLSIITFFILLNTYSLFHLLIPTFYI